MDSISDSQVLQLDEIETRRVTPATQSTVTTESLANSSESTFVEAPGLSKPASQLSTVLHKHVPDDHPGHERPRKVPRVSRGSFTVNAGISSPQSREPINMNI